LRFPEESITLKSLEKNKKAKTYTIAIVMKVFRFKKNPPPGFKTPRCMAFLFAKEH